MEESTMSVTTITVRDLQDNFNDYFEKVQSGQTFAITLDGGILAYLGPHTEKEKHKSTKLAKRKKRNLEDDLPF
ncbi:MAG: hypothetical protein COS37_06840 [Anaerolineae bacterium CG03_land_8_20_14_0_80_58_20]|nr:MAG: hypothetical protein A3K41_00370 [Chloroflexi bacterium RIFOXYD12_FULL_57_15]OIN89859.1 MAG: hypothetical protein AUJ21_09095 [Anaerolineae bacterium CG1_02_58_13]PIV26359.1 MAG: hypothetical protein COS37_06840 [Anaerolineae bacterium CG03_land_8_20_14_0_80_58_20]